MASLTRRFALKLFGIGAAWLGPMAWLTKDRAAIAQTKTGKENDELTGDTTTISWSNTNDRVWLGPSIWANPMENWAVIDGAAECTSIGGNRNLQLITHQLNNPEGALRMSVSLHRAEAIGKDGGAGFRIGIRSELNEYRSNCFVARGIDAGIRDGKLLLGTKQLPLDLDVSKPFRLELTGQPIDNQYRLYLSAIGAEKQVVGKLTMEIHADSVLGNIALVNTFAAKPGKQVASRYRFKDWSVSGSAFEVDSEREFGPILWSMYTLTDSRSDEGFVMKISALNSTLRVEDNHQVELLVEEAGTWK